MATLAHHNLGEHVALFKRLRPCHMSGDETDGDVKVHPPTYRIVETRWQSLELKTFLRALDTMYREKWAAPPIGRATSGNAPRFRIEAGSRIEDGVAPIGLWRNCYDKAWLASLKPHVLQSLKVRDEDYNFSLKDAGSP